MLPFEMRLELARMGAAHEVELALRAEGHRGEVLHDPVEVRLISVTIDIERVSCSTVPVIKAFETAADPHAVDADDGVAEARHVAKQQRRRLAIAQGPMLVEDDERRRPSDVDGEALGVVLEDIGAEARPRRSSSTSSSSTEPAPPAAGYRCAARTDSSCVLAG